MRLVVVIFAVLALVLGAVGMAGSPAGAETSPDSVTQLANPSDRDDPPITGSLGNGTPNNNDVSKDSKGSAKDSKKVTKDNENSDALLAINKTASEDTIKAGDTFYYDIQVSCSSITTPCKNVVITDKFDPAFKVTPPDSVGGANVNFDESTNTLTVTSASMSAGSSLQFRVGITVPADTDIKPGTVVPNVANVTASNADKQEDDANVKVEVPVDLEVTAAKSISPGGGIAGNGQVVKANLGVTNSSTTVTEVDQLRIEDVSSEFFNVFDVHSAGKVTQFPKDADRVIVSVCTEAGGCADDQWKDSGKQAGPDLALPGGVNASDVTGIRYTFVNDKGEPIAAGHGADRTGKIEMEFKARDTFRDNGEKVQVDTSTTVRNEVTPGINGKNDKGEIVWVSGPKVQAPYTLNPNIVRVDSTKSYFVDPKNNFTNGGDDAIANQRTPVSTVVTSTNNSGFPISNITITDPKEGTDLGFFEPIEFRLTFPEGAVKAHVTIKCSGGSEIQKDFLPADGGKKIKPCPEGEFITSASARFESDPKKPAIANGAAAGLSLTGELNGKQQTKNSPLHNIAWVEGDNPMDGSGSFSGEVQDTLTVRTDEPSSGGQTKTTNGVGTIVPGQPLTINMSFNNSGYVPLEHVILADPMDPTQQNDTWDTIRVKKITVSGSGVVADNPPRIELWDPEADGGKGAYVDYKEDDALLERAKGFRVSTTTPLLRGQVINVRLDVDVRDDVKPGAEFTNCMNVSIDGGVTWSKDRCSGGVEVKEGDVSGALQKMFVPGEVPRTLTSATAAEVTTKLRVNNGGPLYLKSLTITDKGDASGGTANFFDAVDVSSTQIFLNKPPGATHTKIELCEFGAGCTADTWVLNNNFSTSNTQNIVAAFRPGVSGAKRIGGIRVTFATSADGKGEALILPTTNFPATGNCPEASVCFKVKPRVTLFSDSKTPVPDKITNGTSAEGESVPRKSAPDGKFPIPPDSSSFQLTEGKRKLDLVKKPNGNISPGGSHEFTLEFKNTGTGIVQNPLLVDRLPDLLDLDMNYGNGPSDPYVVTYAMADDRPNPSAPTTTLTRGGNGKVQQMALQWKEWDMLPGDKVTVKFKVKMMPGATTGMKLENEAGVTGDGFNSLNPEECTAPTTSGGVIKGIDSSGYFGPAGQLFCTSKAHVTTQEGNAFASYKWVAGTLDWFYIPSNVGTGRPAFEKVSESSCPTISKNGRTYTRYPCVALIHPGEQFDYILRLSNAGTNPVKEIRVADSLPHKGDQGTWVPSPRLTDWEPSPTLAGEVSSEGPSGMSVKTGYSDQKRACVEDLLPGHTDRCDFSGAPDASTGSFFTQVLFDEGELLPPGGFVDLELTMDSPSKLEDRTQLPIAWNSFGQSAWAREPNGKDKFLLPAEPEKVGVGMMFSRLEVEKKVSGHEGGNDTTSPFPVEYKCSFTGKELTSGKGEVVPGKRTVLTEEVFPDVECDIWETDSRGATSSATKDNPLKVKMPAFDPASAEQPESIGFGAIENTFPPPTPPTPSPSETTGSGEPPSPSGPTQSPSDNGGDAGPGWLPHTGGGWAILIGIIGLIVIALGVVMRRIGRNRSH